MCVCLSVHFYHMHAGNCEGQKRVLDLMKLELQMVVSLHVGARNLTQVLFKSS